MLDTAIAFLWPDTAADLILQGDGVDARPPVGASGNVAEYRDGWATTMTLSDDEFHGMCRALGCAHVADDPRFATLAARQRNRPALLEVLRGEMADASRKLTLAEAAERFAAEDVPFARARRLDRTARRSADRSQPGVQHAGASDRRNAAPRTTRAAIRPNACRTRRSCAGRRGNTRARSSLNSA